jgi:hypothetical protein
MKTSNLIVLSEQDLETFREYNAATPEQKALIWALCEKKIPDLLMGDFWDVLELCITKGLEGEIE